MCTPIILLSVVGSGHGEDLVQALREVHAEELLLPVLIQLVVIILVARLFANIFRRLGQPGVVGEIAAGLLLGPSFLGYFFPEVAGAIFHPAWVVPDVPPALFDATLNWIFTSLSQVGLILLLFLIGLEFDFSHLRAHGRSAVAISGAGIVLPFALGIGVAVLLHPVIEPHPVSQRVPDPFPLALFMGTAMSITALPILGRMMIEWRISRTRVGAVTISAAATDDAMGWTLLAAVSAIAGGGYDPWITLRMVGLTVGFAVGMHWIVGPILRRWVRWTLERNRGDLGLDSLAVLLSVVFTCAIATNLIGIFGIFGAFSAGAVLSAEHEFREAVTRKLRDLVTVFFLPVFFTYTGLRTDIGSLGSAQLWLLCGAVLAAAIIGKFAGCGLAAWVSGFPAREAACIGAMMNTRALMELIVINVGFQLHVIPLSVFCMLVIMALVTTAMTTPVFMRLMRGTELEPLIREARTWNPRF